MSALRVTDVQAALRHFQSVGHDVLTNPRMLNLDGREYGIAALHHLRVFHNRGELLQSHLMQSERPLLSEMHTQSFEPENGMQRISRFVSPLQPRIHTSEKKGTSHHSYESNTYISDPGYWAEDSHAPVGSVLWTPDTFWTQGPHHKDIHEALESHRSSEVSHIGTLIPNGSYKNARAMDSADRFNNKEALANTLPSKEVFKGLVSVSHTLPDNKRANYIYNPDTEQLLKVH